MVLRNTHCRRSQLCVHGLSVVTCLLTVGYSEKQDDRKDLSHPVHVDNCLLVSEMNECIKEPPAYTHRDYR